MGSRELGEDRVRPPAGLALLLHLAFEVTDPVAQLHVNVRVIVWSWPVGRLGVIWSWLVVRLVGMEKHVDRAGIPLVFQCSALYAATDGLDSDPQNLGGLRHGEPPATGL